MSKKPGLSIVIPVYNDEEVLHELHKRLKAVLPELASKHEILFIDDGSRDKSFSILKEIAKKDPFVRVIKLARNFGQQNSISAGMDHAKGDIIVLMDSDLQDRPEDIHLLLEAMERDDTDMAIAKWITRKDSFRKRFFSKLFYKVSRQ
jgi:dolichol-phosphate mannosyltransferase